MPQGGKSQSMKGIRQLAEHLDISIGTVSRALNGKPDVNEETRKRVLAAAEELGYVANQSGRSLRQGTTNVIGLMIESSKETIESNAESECCNHDQNINKLRQCSQFVK